jgi:hypothetical protein
MTDVWKAMKKWRMPSRSGLNGLAAEVYDEGVQKLVTRCDKCLNVGDYYVEK